MLQANLTPSSSLHVVKMKDAYSYIYLKKKEKNYFSYVNTVFRVMLNTAILQTGFVKQPLKIHPVITNVFRKPNLHQRRHLFTINSPHDTLLAVIIFVVKDSLMCQLLTARSLRLWKFALVFLINCVSSKIKGPFHMESSYTVDVKKFI